MSDKAFSQPGTDDQASVDVTSPHPAHTPGPWFAEHGTDGYYFVGDADGAALDDDTAANARLIEAAPELLEALQLFDAYLALPQDRGGERGPKGVAHQRWLTAKTAAIAKATGGQP